MILAVESSCDESAIALFDPATGVVDEWVHSQIDLHKEYGGVVPDLASREHLKNFIPLLEAAELNNGLSSISKIAVTRGPGLAGCLALGIAFARSLGVAWGLPVVGVNHLRGHAFSPFIDLHKRSPDQFHDAFGALLPHLGLVVSGGNTILFEINTDKRLKILAETVDDAAGEALDKGAKLLGLAYPGGPEVECLAAMGDDKVFEFPKAIAPRNERRFSFSGLKTSLRYRLEKMGDVDLQSIMPDLCAGYQRAVIEQLVGKTKHLIQASEYCSLGISGGVSNNKVLRASMGRLAQAHRMPLLAAQPQHTGDNAAMIAFAAFFDTSALALDEFNIDPSLTLAPH